MPWYQDCAYPSKEDYTAVSKQLVQKYPVLKDSYGNGYVSVYVYMCVCEHAWVDILFLYIVCRDHGNSRSEGSSKISELLQKLSVVNAQGRRIKKTSNHHSTHHPNEKIMLWLQLKKKKNMMPECNSCRRNVLKKSKLIAAMESTVAKRRQWIHNESPSVAGILEKFPPLTLGIKYVS